MRQLFPPSTEEMIGECEREIRQRENVYPRLIAQGRLTKPRAERQIEVMRAIIERLREEKTC